MRLPFSIETIVSLIFLMDVLQTIWLAIILYDLWAIRHESKSK